MLSIVADTSAIKVSTLPIHLFLDLSLLERLLPILRHISPIVKAGRPSGRESPDITPFPIRTVQSVLERAPSYVIDDLDAQAASVSTLRPAAPSSSATFECPLIRLDIRCPAPPARRGTWGDGAHLRSGIVTLDLHNFQTTLGASEAVSTRGRNAPDDVGSATWDKMLLFFSRAPSELLASFRSECKLILQARRPRRSSLSVPSRPTLPI